MRAYPGMVCGKPVDYPSNAALDSIVGGVSIPLLSSVGIDIAHSQFGNRATLQLVNRHRVHDADPVQMTGGSSGKASGAARRREDEHPKTTGKTQLSVGATAPDASLGAARFFRNATDFVCYVAKIRRQVEATRSRDPGYYSPFRLIKDYKYGVIEAIVAQTDPEVINENLERIGRQYGSVKPEPGTLDFFRMAAKNSRGQYEGIPHLTGLINMGGRSFHSHLRVDQRQLIEKDEEGKEVMGKNGMPLRKVIRPAEQPGDYGVPEGTVLPPRDVPYTFIEDFNDCPTHYKGEKLRGHPPTSTTFIPFARFSGTPLPQAFSALMLAELAKNASMGAYNQTESTCVPWPLDLARVGGADIKRISPEYVSGERALQNTQMSAEIDTYLACHTNYHANTKVLRELREQEATVVGRDGMTRPLNFHEGTFHNPGFEVFARYPDGTQPWKEPQGAPWPWQMTYHKKAISSQTYGPKFGPYRDVEEFRRDVATVQRWVNRQKAQDPDYAMYLTFDRLKFGIIEAVLAHTPPEVVEANLKRIEEQYRGVQVMPGKATYYRYLTCNQHGQHRHISYPSVKVTMGDKSVHGGLRADSRRYKDTNERVRPRFKPEDYGLDPGVTPGDMTILAHPDTDFRAQYKDYPGTADKVKEIARFENIELPEAFTALLLMEFWHLASVGPYDVHRTTCVPISLDILAAGGADMKKISPHYMQGGRSMAEAELMLQIDRFLAFNTEHHVKQEILDLMRDPQATVVSPKDRAERPLNIFGENMPGFLAKYAGLEPWKWLKGAPWPWDREYWEDKRIRPG